MKRPPTVPPPGAAVLCFLCGRPVVEADLPLAWSRVLSDEVPSRVDFAHCTCAFTAGYYDQPEDDEDHPR